MAFTLRRVLFLWVLLVLVCADGGRRRRINLRFPASILERPAGIEAVVTNDDHYPTLAQNATSAIAESMSLAKERFATALATSRALREGVSGAAAAAVQVAALMWLRTTSSYQAKYDVSFTDALGQLYEDGGVARFYRGLPMALLQGPLSRAGSVSANAFAENLLHSDSAGSSVPSSQLIEEACRVASARTLAVAHNAVGGIVATANMTGGPGAAETVHRLGDSLLSGATAAGTAGSTAIAALWNRAPTLSPAALGSVLSGLWRVVLMPLDTIKTVQQVEGGKGFQRLMGRVLGGEVGLLFQGSRTTLLAAASGHYPWFYVYSTLDEQLRRPGQEVAEDASDAAGQSETPSAWLPAGGLAAGAIEEAWRKFCNSRLWENKLLRSAFIGFAASTASDIVSNVFRVLKTLKQTQSVGPALTPPAHISLRSMSGTGAGRDIFLPRTHDGAELSSSTSSSASYLQIAQSVAQQPGGLVGLFSRGLLGRVLSNGLQSVLFTVLWREMAAALANAFPPSDSSITSSGSATGGSTDTKASAGGTESS